MDANINDPEFSKRCVEVLKSIMEQKKQTPAEPVGKEAENGCREKRNFKKAEKKY